jgi:hypothetical protein
MDKTYFIEGSIRLTRTREIRRTSMLKISNMHCSAITDLPTAGTVPSLEITKPATVSYGP